jgi:hypothetical protein
VTLRVADADKVTIANFSSLKTILISQQSIKASSRLLH